MNMTVTLAALAVCLALAVLCGWRGAAAPDPHRGPRMIPWRFLMILCGAAALFLLVHLANLAGVKTGR